MSDPFRIGIGSASAEDRIEPAIELIEGAELDYLSLDCLAERTLAFAQLRRIADPEAGYDLRLDHLVREVVARCLARGTRFIANMGAANPGAAAQRTRDLLAEMDATGTRIASITGDDVLDKVLERDPQTLDGGLRVSELDGEIVCANAYIGSDAIVEALDAGADVVIGGRIADPSLFLGPAAFEHGWAEDDWDARAGGLVSGHLLECGTYLTGANWVDPPYRTVPDLWNLGLPFADVHADGSCVVSKLEGSGGAVSVDNCKAELIYEVGDPGNYLTPDLVLDMTGIELEELGPNRVRATGARGKPPTDSLKVLVGCLEGWIAEGEVSFGGPGALQRAQLCADVVRERLEHDGIAPRETRVDFIGVDSVFGPATPRRQADPWEVRLRIATRVPDEETAGRVRQALTLTWFGPAGAGGVRTTVRQLLGMHSVLLPRADVPIGVELTEV